LFLNNDSNVAYKAFPYCVWLRNLSVETSFIEKGSQGEQGKKIRLSQVILEYLPPANLVTNKLPFNSIKTLDSHQN